MALHGGTFVVNYARSAVTHIICSHLTDRKVQLFKKMRWVIGMQQHTCLLLNLWHGTPFELPVVRRKGNEMLLQAVSLDVSFCFMRTVVCMSAGLLQGSQTHCASGLDR